MGFRVVLCRTFTTADTLVSARMRVCACSRCVGVHRARMPDALIERITDMLHDAFINSITPEEAAAEREFARVANAAGVAPSSGTGQRMGAGAAPPTDVGQRTEAADAPPFTGVGHRLDDLNEMD